MTAQKAAHPALERLPPVGVGLPGTIPGGKPAQRDQARFFALRTN